MSLESTHFLWVMSPGTTYMCICPELCHQGHHICLGAMSLESTHFLGVMSSGTSYFSRSYFIRVDTFSRSYVTWDNIYVYLSGVMSSGTSYFSRSYFIRVHTFSRSYVTWDNIYVYLSGVMSSGTSYFSRSYFIRVDTFSRSYVIRDIIFFTELCHQGQHICREGNTNLGIRPGIKHWPRFWVLSFLYLVIAFS